MAKVIESKVESRKIGISYPVWSLILIGILAGFFYWLLVVFIDRYINLTEISGEVAMILVSTASLIAMIFLRVPRSILVIVATAISLWSLAALTEGLNRYEIVAWNILLFTICYLLFAWIGRYRHAATVIVIATVVVVLTRIIVVM